MCWPLVTPTSLLYHHRSLNVPSVNVLASIIPSLLTAAVDIRVALQLNETSVYVSWEDLTIPDFEIDNYTVMYAPVLSTSNGSSREEMEAEFPGSASSALIGGLAPEISYQFQVFATVMVEGLSLEGERSQPLLASGEAFVTHAHTHTHTVCFLVV